MHKPCQNSKKPKGLWIRFDWVELGKLGGLVVRFQVTRVGCFCKNFQIRRSFFTKQANLSCSLVTRVISGKNPYPKKLGESY